MNCNIMLSKPAFPFGKPACLDQHRYHHCGVAKTYEYSLNRTLAAATVVFASMRSVHLLHIYYINIEVLGCGAHIAGL